MTVNIDSLLVNGTYHETTIYVYIDNVLTVVNSLLDVDIDIEEEIDGAYEPAWPIPGPQVSGFEFVHYEDGCWEDSSGGFSAQIRYFHDSGSYSVVGSGYYLGRYSAIYAEPYGWYPWGSGFGHPCGLVISTRSSSLESEGFAAAWPINYPLDFHEGDSIRFSRGQWTVNGRFYEEDGTEVFEDWNLEYDAEVSGILYPYSTDVPSTLEAVIPDALCLGIEAEFSHYNGLGLQTALSSADGKALFKKDGSCGVELVSIPLLPSEMLAFIDNLAISKLGVDRTCGVHVHLTRKELSQSQLGGLVVFMNHPQNLAYITEIAGREPNGFCKHVAGKVDTQSSDRYEMVNLTNRMTIEIRIFAGTNDIKVLQGYVEWLLDLIEWLGTNPVSYLASEFIAYTNN